MVQHKTPTESDVLTVGETADYLKLSTAQVYSLTARGDLPSFKIGRSVRVSRARLDQWLERQARDWGRR